MAKAKANPTGNAWKSDKPAPIAPSNLASIGVPSYPEHLGATGREMWMTLWSGGRDSYRASDANVIERYCSMCDRRSEFLRAIEAEGWIGEGSMGQPVQHPAAKLLIDVESKMLQIEDRLGLNPESRLRLGMAEITRVTKLDQFLADG